ncbi:hypothetical protein A1O3_06364 [Capronia epimyces CBS 606.96]|uniref:Uncharacterized protein n=1 Tax=Capronia epimyces CBS 606.96 TaxID=1182542 RepID=W9XZZ6_9EURO|nr:uncharacterized protein A1O3_06364 [Capronia epimyces CBS 606.96]EXJ82551.1 hypothetical protein A1O3_06364 [Capronia epimyces CBS 606.96]
MIHTSQEATTTPAQPQKFLRYRSIRKTAVKNPDPDPAPPLPQPSQSSQTTITRLPSRYHRKPKPETTPPHAPDLPQDTPTHNHGVTERREPVPDQHVDQHGHKPDAREPLRRDIAHKHTLSADSARAGGLRRSYEVAREEARLILEGEVERLRELRAREAQRQREQREQRETRNDGQVTYKKGSGKTGGLEQLPKDTKGSQSRTLVIGGPPLLRKGKQHSRASSGNLKQYRPTTYQGHATTNSVGRTDQTRGTTPPTSVPNFDAPVSAVNAGNRRVGVTCKTASITLPVTPSTTCTEILISASACMSEQIDPRSAILLESFSQLGLERPLRRYERIRDVMNSWDNDNQHHLSIMAEGECASRGLKVGDAPTQQPTGATVQIYHSHKPGQWDKRWVRLKEDGQITISKKEKGLDSTNICHLSDFDLYTPTAKQVKLLNPPKKLCFALKSQEKSSMFLSGANFVHFFCTKDKTMADKWCQAVHSWRSWYLVNMLGEGLQIRTAPTTRHQPGTRSSAQSKDSSPNVPGLFQPLLDFRRSRPSGEGSRRTDSGASHRPSQDVPRPLIDFVPEKQTAGSRPGSPAFHPLKPQPFPPNAFPNKFVTEAAHTTGNSENAEGPFTGTGLLARSASRRSQGGSRSGRGVQGVDGKPLIELHPTSEFTDGSLLRKMEAIAAQQGALQPKIDREKRREMDVSVGEGFGG